MRKKSGKIFEWGVRMDPLPPQSLNTKLGDAIEAASVVDPRDRRNFLHHSRNLGRYYDLIPLDRNLNVLEKVSDDAVSEQ